MKIYFHLLCLYFLIAWSLPISSQVIHMKPEDTRIYETYVSSMKQGVPGSWEDILVETARFFMDMPYVSATLEKQPERLVINLREMDCTTLVENVLALSETYLSGDTSWENFCNHLKRIRYRGGVVDGYASRLHYATDWIYENEKKGILKDITREIGGVILPIKLDFMSTHPDSYIQLKQSPDLVAAMASIENEINGRSYYYIPEEDIDKHYNRMSNGDIVFFTTNIQGLDVTHMGIIYKMKDSVTFIHASSSAKKVIVNPEPLKEYVKKIKNNTGIIVARPLPVS